MNDQERLAEALARVADTLAGLSVPDADQDDLLHKAAGLIDDARDLAIERS